MPQSIDFVITYVDGNDKKWQTEKNKYIPGGSSDINVNRYREWNNLHYLFRGIEKFAPWVRYVHFVTYGHIPTWLNVNHPKLHVVNHSDYIPAEWLPTFNNRCIELNLHRIPGLSEQFVYFNDDMFITNRVREEDFFHDGKPCDSAILYAVNYKMVDGVALHLAPIVDTAVINKYFDMKRAVKNRPSNWINLKYGMYNFMTLPLLIYKNFPCFLSMHLPYSYLKSVFETIWEKEPGLCVESSSHRFRNVPDINQWLMNYWQLASNTFYPRSIKFGKAFQIHTICDAERAAKGVLSSRYKTICLNDTVENKDDFDQILHIVNKALDTILPEKSAFEL